MVKDIIIKQIYTDSLSCEPLLEKMPNGELLCVCQCGGTREPDLENRVYVFHSKDGGESWSEPESIYPEDGQAVYCTELSVIGEEITAYLTVHTGRFLDWKCFMMKSFDNGYTWKNYGSPPHLPEYTFIRATVETSDHKLLIPYHYYPVSKEGHDRVAREEEDKAVWLTGVPYCETGVLISEDGGKSWEKYVACRMDMSEDWFWTEPTIAELSDKTLVMLMRRREWLYRCESKDGGKTWSDYVQTDIPNPSNKPRLFSIGDGKIALIHTPSNSLSPKGAVRSPLQLWISDDDMKTWSFQKTLTDFPGAYSYTDGFYEDGHIKFVIEHNRHTILYFDVTL